MNEALTPLVDALRDAGARFVYLVGSRAAGTARESSDTDLAVYFGRTDIAPWTIPGVDFERVDLLVLDTAPLEDSTRLAALDYIFQTGIEACIDSAHHVCASEGWAPPKDNADAMRVLHEHGVLNSNLSS